MFVKNLMAAFNGWESTSRRQSHSSETVYFLPLSPQKFLVLILSSSEDLPSGFESGTPGLEHPSAYCGHCFEKSPNSKMAFLIIWSFLLFLKFTFGQNSNGVTLETLLRRKIKIANR